MRVVSSSFAALLVKETRALFTSTIAYTVIAVFLLLMGYSFTTTLFVHKTSSLIHVFYQSALLMLLLVPILTMRLFAEERRSGTLEVLLTSPAQESEIVFAKYLASMAVMAVMIGLTLFYPLTLEIFGDPDWGTVYSGYLGLVLFAAALTSIGLAVSSLVDNQIIAAMVSLCLFLLLWMLDSLAALLPAPFDGLVADLSLAGRLTPFLTGAMYFSDFGFFLTVILLGLLASVRALARR